MGRLAFTVVVGPWYSDGNGPNKDGSYSDDVVVDDASPELIRLSGHAHAAGVLDVTEGLDLEGVQSQEDGEAAYKAAQGEPDKVTGKYTGPWMEGQQAQAEIDDAHKAVTAAEKALDEYTAENPDGDSEALRNAVVAAEKALVRTSKQIDKRLKGGDDS